jgi:catechol 2,3-dioxygenase-like lactoylglutathione lyase family enzyme
MLAAQPIMAFVATRDAARARAFYQGTLGLPLISDEPYALVFDASGTTLRVQKVETHAPAPYTVLGWRVPSVTMAVRTLASQGISFERYDFLKQDRDGVWTTPNGSKVAWFKDPDGNVLSLTEG